MFLPELLSVCSTVYGWANAFPSFRGLSPADKARDSLQKLLTMLDGRKLPPPNANKLAPPIAGALEFIPPNFKVHSDVISEAWPCGFYSPPKGNDGMAKRDPRVREVEVTISRKQTRRAFYAISDLHWVKEVDHIRWKDLDKFRELIYNAEAIHSIILLGDIFEMSVINSLTNPDVHNRPPHHVLDFISLIKDFNSRGVTIYYLEGNQDSQLNDQMIQTIFENTVIFVEDILRLGVTDEENGKRYQIHFEHGDHLDILHSVHVPSARLLDGQPLGYYLAGVIEYGLHPDPQEALVKLVEMLFTIIQKDYDNPPASFYVSIFKDPDLFKEFLTTLFNEALRHSDSKSLSWTPAGRTISINEVLRFPWFQSTPDLELWQGLLSLLGIHNSRYQSWSREGDNVVVLAHTHRYNINPTKNLFYINTGSWVNSARTTYVEIRVPSGTRDGWISAFHPYRNRNQFNSVSATLFHEAIRQLQLHVGIVAKITDILQILQNPWFTLVDVPEIYGVAILVVLNLTWMRQIWKAGKIRPNGTTG